MSVIAKKNAGAITLLMLVFLIITVLILVAVARLISLQTNTITNQEQEEQAFGAADAGVEYARWLLSSTGGNVAPNALGNIENQVVKDIDGQPMATFDVGVETASADLVEIVSRGRDATRTNICQTIEATIAGADGVWAVTRWQHTASVKCANLPSRQVVVASPTPPPPLQSNLAHYWPLESPRQSGIYAGWQEDKAGNTDLHGGIDGPEEDTVTGGLRFDGSDSLQNVSDTSVRLSNNFSMSFWLLNRKPAGGSELIISEPGDGNSDFPGWSVVTAGQQQIAFNFRDSGGQNRQLLSPPNTIQRDQLYHVAITGGAGTASLYINGNLAQATSYAPGLLRSGNYNPKLLIGMPPNCTSACINNSFRGVLDDIRIYNKALTAGEISDLAQR